MMFHWYDMAKPRGRYSFWGEGVSTKSFVQLGEEACWKKLASLLPLEKFCYGWLHRRLLRRYRPQSAVNCSTLWERAAGSTPNTSQVSLHDFFQQHWRNRVYFTAGPCRLQGIAPKQHVSRKSVRSKPLSTYFCSTTCESEGDLSLDLLLGRGPHKNCKNDLDDQTWRELE